MSSQDSLTAVQVNHEIAKRRSAIRLRSDFRRGTDGVVLDYPDCRPPRGVVGSWQVISDTECCPDYCGSWEHAGPLLVDMRDGAEMNLVDWGDRWTFLADPSGLTGSGATPTEAISRAWLAANWETTR